MLYIAPIKQLYRFGSFDSLQMSRVSHRLSQLLAIVEASTTFQRYFSLIKLLQVRKQQTQSQLKAMRQKLAQLKGNVKQARELTKSMIVVYRRFYGLSKEKIEVCHQFQELIQHLRSQLNALLHRYKTPRFVQLQRSLGNFQEELKRANDGERRMTKYKSKMMKMAKLADRLDGKRDNSQQHALSTPQMEETNCQVYERKGARRMKIH